MQALGSYKKGKMLFLGLGTGLGTALVIGGMVEPMELGHLPYKKATYEDYVGLRGLKKRGKKKWRKYVFDVVEISVAFVHFLDHIRSLTNQGVCQSSLLVVRIFGSPLFLGNLASFSTDCGTSIDVRSPDIVPNTHAVL